MEDSVSMISLSIDLSIFVYKNDMDFCFLILYSATLLNVFIRCRSFLDKFLGILVYKTTLFSNKNTLTTPFPICVPFIYFGCLIALAKMSGIVVYKIDI